MSDQKRQLLKARTEVHSDVPDSPAARAHHAELTERQFLQQVLQHLRTEEAGLRLSHFREEWVTSDEGLVHEISCEVSA